MSYFICGFKADKVACNDFETILVEVVPDHIKSDIARLEGESSYLAMYGNKKAIRNIAIRDDRHGSWLAVIGTPLVRLESEQEEQAFLDEVLTSPADALRMKIDGNFAAFAYDGLRGRLIAATDFNNTTPVFYTMTPKGALFSSHELPLARFVHAEIDPFGFAQLMHLGVTWNSHTRFRNIYKMLPCQICVIEDDMKLRTERYWEPQHERMWSGAFEDHIQKWILMLKESVWKFYECSD